MKLKKLIKKIRKAAGKKNPDVVFLEEDKLFKYFVIKKIYPDEWISDAHDIDTVLVEITEDPTQRGELGE